MGWADHAIAELREGRVAQCRPHGGSIAVECGRGTARGIHHGTENRAVVVSAVFR